MSGAALEDLVRTQALLATGHRDIDARYTDFMGEFAADPALVEQARTQLAQLNALGSVLKRDWESRMLRDALAAMLAQFDGGQ